MSAIAAHQQCLLIAIDIYNDHSEQAFDKAKKRIKDIAKEYGVEPKAIYLDYLDVYEMSRKKPLSQVVDVYKSLLERVIEQGECLLENVIYVNLGRLYAAFGQYQVALEYLMIAHRNEHVFEPSFAMVLYIFLSDIYLKLEDNPLAIFYGQKVLTPENILANPFPIAINYHNIALAQIRLGQLDPAQENLSHAKKLAQGCKNEYAIAYNSLAQAEWYHVSNENDKAEACYVSAIASMTVTGVNNTIIEVHQEYAFFLIKQQRYAEALEHLNIGLAHDVDKENIIKNIELYHQLFTCYKKLGKVDQAYQQVEQQYSYLLKIRDNLFKDQSLQVRQSIANSEKSQKTENYLQAQNLMTAMSAIGQRIATCDDLDDILPDLLQDISAFLPCEYVSLSMLDLENDRLNNTYQIDINGRIPAFNQVYSEKSSMASYCCYTRESVLLNTGLPSEVHYYLPHLKQKSTIVYVPGTETMTFSGIFSPVILGDELLGCISLQHRKTYLYQQHHLDVLEQLAQYIAIAIKNIKQKKQLELLSKTDALTGLLNRYELDAVAKECIRKKSKDLSMLMIDIDYFKQYNDTLGHSAGDQLLITLSRIMKTTFAQKGHVFRYGGDEFFVLLEGSSTFQANAFANQLRENVQNETLQHPQSSVSDFVTLTMGVATCITNPDLSLKTLIQMADKALYQGKEKGRGSVISINYAAEAV